MRPRPPLLAALSCALLVALAAGAQESADGEPSAPPARERSLRFDWPVGLAARVEAEYARKRVDGADRFVQRNRVRFRFTVEPSENGVHVRASDYSTEPVTFSAGEGPVLPRERQSAEERIATEIALLFPSFHVHLGGRVRSLDPVDAIRAFAEARIAEVQAYEPIEPAARARLLSQYASQGGVAKHIYITWRWLVLYWVLLGGDEDGRAEARDEGVLSDLGGLPIEFVTQLENAGPMPCRSGEEELRCVRLVGRNFPDALQLEQVIAGIPELDSYGTGWNLTVIAEPATLIPHSMVFRDEFYGTRAADGGEPVVFESVDERRYWFFYDSEGSGG